MHKFPLLSINGVLRAHNSTELGLAETVLLYPIVQKQSL